MNKKIITVGKKLSNNKDMHLCSIHLFSKPLYRSVVLNKGNCDGNSVLLQTIHLEMRLTEKVVSLENDDN